MDTGEAARLEALSRIFPPTYALERQVGQGGMARVYRAIDRKHGRPVAIKIMRSELTSADGTARFLDEIQLTARLSHPHILPLLDSGAVEDTPFFVMPFVEGESLRQRLRAAGRLPVEEAVRLIGEVADALAYAHAQGVVHCDVKPDNIMLSGRHALVADFGVARAMRAAAADEAATRLTVVTGTPSYMSPEQAFGSQDIDGRSDVYSLGVVAFELLAGILPYPDAPLQEVLTRRPGGPLPSIRLHDPVVPDALDRIVQSAMAFDRHERCATAAEFADAIAAVGRRTSAAFAALAPAAAPAFSSIAVLPLRNLSPDPDSDYLSDGITEEITAALGRLRAFRVCAYTSASVFKGRAIEPRMLGERLGARHLLTGSVRRSGGRLRVSVELVNAADGLQLWADKYERTFSDVLNVQDAIAEAIAASIAAHAARVADPGIRPDEVPTVAAGLGQRAPRLEPARAHDPRASELYLRGRSLWNRRTTASLAGAISSFEDALSLDPGFVPAHAGLAAARVMMAVYGAAPPSAAMGEARAAAGRALAIDPTCVEARTVLALIAAGHDWDWTRAEREFLAAAAAAPSDATPHQWLATMCLVPAGRIDEALEAVGRALRRDPLSLTVKTALASVLYSGRRYREAIVAARDVVALDPGFAPAHFFLGQAQSLLGDHAEAVRSCVRACELSSRSAESLAVLAVALGRSGDLAGAGAVRDEMASRAASGYVSKGQLALASVAVGDAGAAFRDLDAAVEERAADLIWLGARPVWDPIRGQPPFRRILERLGLVRDDWGQVLNP